MNSEESTLVCEQCGGTNIEAKAWVDPNDNTVLDVCSNGEVDDNWCRDCEEHVFFCLKSEFKYDKDDE